MKQFLPIVLSAALAFTLGCSGSSSTTTTSTPAATVPSAPTALTATAGNGQVSLTWTASTGATSYNIYYAGATATQTKLSGITATSSTVTGLTNAVPYFFVVTAVNSAGESANSSQASATPVPPAPAAPATLTATAGNAQVALSWTASSGATSYNVYYSLTSGVTAANGTKISVASGTTYTQTGLTNGSTYYYIVTAVNAGGESAASTQASAKPLAPVPAAPTGVTATAGNGQAVVSWTASAGATSYNVYYGTSSAVTPTSGTKIGAISGVTYTVPSLTNGTLYYFIVTAVNGAGESAASASANAIPTNGVNLSLVPGTAATGTVQATTTTSLTFTFPATAVSVPATATVNTISQANLPAPLLHSGVSAEAVRDAGATPKVQLTDTFIASFSIGLYPSSIVTFNAGIGVSGSVGSVVPVNTTLILAVLQNNTWVDVTTFIIGTSGSINQNLASLALPGLLAPGTYLVYRPAAGTSTSVSNLGVALIADDGHRMADGSNGLQVVHLYSATGALLATPTINDLDYPGASDLDGQALTPDGSQGIMVDGGNTVRFFSSVQTGTPVASTKTVGIGAYGGDGDSVAILPNGDEAVVSGDSPSQLVVISGIVAGSPVAATTIPIPGNRDGLVISTDGKVLLARGPNGLTVFSVASIAPIAGTVGGTVSHSYTKVLDSTTLGTNYYFEDGRDGMAMSPVDASRAVVVQSGVTSASTIQILTSLTTATPVVGATLALPTGVLPYSVSVSPDGKLAVVGTSSGLLLFSGVDTGTLVAVGGIYAPTYTLGTASKTLGQISTLGITLDGKYVLAGDATNSALVVVPFTVTGFASAPASVLGSVAIPDNDQLVVH